MPIDYVSTYDRLMKFAQKNYEMKRDWAPVMEHVYKRMQRSKQASMNKRAYGESTARFVNYVTLSYEMGRLSPVSEKDARSFLERNWSIDVKLPEDQKDRSGPRFQRGDLIKIKAKKHKVGHTQDVYDSHDRKEGTVIATPNEDPELAEGEHGDVLVEFDDGTGPIRFPGAMKPQGVGIYKDNGRNADTPKGAKLEMVYFSAGDREPDAEAMKDLEDYIEQGNQVGEDRVPYYYSGLPFTAAVSKDGNFYFRIQPDQRHNKWRAYSPKKGKLLYIGRLPQDRPSGWERDYQELMHEMRDRR